MAPVGDSDASLAGPRPSVQLEIDDREGYDRYANADHGRILARLGGRVVVAEDDVKTPEGDGAGTARSS